MRIRSRELFYLSLVFLLTVIAWIAVDIYGIRKNKAFIIDYQKSTSMEIKPLESSQVIEKLEQRK